MGGAPYCSRSRRPISARTARARSAFSCDNKTPFLRMGFCPRNAGVYRIEHSDLFNIEHLRMCIVPADDLEVARVGAKISISIGTGDGKSWPRRRSSIHSI
jgi:hypothetical protein